MLILTSSVYADRSFLSVIACVASTIGSCGVDCRAGTYWGVTALAGIDTHRIPHLHGKITVLYRDYTVIYGTIPCRYGKIR